MGKSSSPKTLNKIHTYAQDLEVARQATKDHTVTAKVVSVPQMSTPHINPPTPLTPPSTSPASLAVMVLPKVSLPSIRTMEADSKKINPSVSGSTKKNFSHDSMTTAPSYQKTPQVITTPVKQVTNDDHQNDTLPQKARGTETVPNEKEKIPKLQKREAITTPPKPQTMVVPKNSRDTTYAATLITDKKRKRFSVWKELGKKINAFIEKKISTKQNSYIAPVIPLAKGQVKSAVTKTSKPSLAEYAALKERIKNRPIETVAVPLQHRDASIISNTIINPSFDNGEILPENAIELKKTRTKLLSTIEREVSIHHELPAPTVMVGTDSKYGPVFVELKHNTAAATPERDAFETPVGWDYFTETDEANKIAPPLTTPQTNPTPKATTPVPTIAVPHPDSSTPNVAPTIPTETQHNVITPKIITPIIPVVSPEPATQNTLSTPTPTVPEHPVKNTLPPATPPPVHNTGISSNYHTEFISPNQTTESNLHYQPSPVFTQPKIVPSLPAEYQEITRVPKPIHTHQVTAQPTVSALPTDVAITQTYSAPTIGNLTTTTPPTRLATTPQRTTTAPTSPSIRSAVLEYITKYTQTFVLSGLITATIIIAGTVTISSYIAQRGSTEKTFSAHQYFNSSTLHPVPLSSLSQLTITEALIQHNNAIGVSEIVLQDKEGVTVSPTILTSVLQLPIDPAFSGILLDMRFGWYREEPFIVLRYSGDSIARGALLQWERTMHTDLMPLFGIPTATTVTPFTDATIGNIDIRKKVNADEQELIYGVVAPGHIIITTSEMSFLNLTNNFNVR